MGVARGQAGWDKQGFPWSPEVMLLCWSGGLRSGPQSFWATSSSHSDSLVQRLEVLEASQELGVRCEVRNCLSSDRRGDLGPGMMMHACSLTTWRVEAGGMP